MSFSWRFVSTTFLVGIGILLRRHFESNYGILCHSRFERHTASPDRQSAIGGRSA
jgi:hypothetical protein